MARKRLSDLLREEVQKPGDATTIAPAPAIAPVAAELVEPDAPAPNGQSSEVTALAQQAADLQQQLEDLKTDLKQQAAATKKLQTQLEQVEKRNHQLETELAEAKQTALQLADNNAQLQQDLKTLQQARSQPQPTPVQPLAKQPLAKQPPAATKSVASPPPAVAKPAASGTLSQQEILRRRQAESLAHPMFPAGNAPGYLSEQDMGWVD